MMIRSLIETYQLHSSDIILNLKALQHLRFHPRKLLSIVTPNQPALCPAHDTTLHFCLYDYCYRFLKPHVTHSISGSTSASTDLYF